MKRYILLALIIIGTVVYFIKRTEINTIFNISSDNKSVFSPNQNEFSLKVTIKYLSGDAWKLISNRKTELKEGDVLAEGDEIMTGVNSNMILAFDDGSILMIGANTDTKLSWMKPQEILINQTKGQVFARVNKDEAHQFKIKSGTVLVKSMGTAFSVENVDEIKVKVFDSKVSINKENGESTEVTKDQEWTEKKNIVEPIKTEEVKSDKFLAWSLEQEKIEIVENIKVEVKKEEPQVAENIKEETPKIVLSGNKVDAGIYVSWGVTNVNTDKGFKIVTSNDPNPTFPEDGYIYIEDGSTRHYTLSIKDGNSHNIRVCNYLSNGKCGTYSNNIIVTAPEGSDNGDEDDNSGDVESIKLTASKKSDEKVSLSWDTDGNSEMGFKIVWSKEPHPTYPNRKSDKYLYLNDSDADEATIDDLDNGDKYYFRVCEYLGGKCGKYSNEVSIDL